MLRRLRRSPRKRRVTVLRSTRRGGSKTTTPNKPKIPIHQYSQAASVARTWVEGLAASDLDRMLAVSALPFKANGRVVAKNRKKLRIAFKELAGEAKAAARRTGKPARLKALRTASGLRKAIGFMPAKLTGGSAADLYGVARIGNDRVILVVAKRSGQYRVVALQR
jgi:hypothetical protein